MTIPVRERPVRHHTTPDRPPPTTSTLAFIRRYGGRWTVIVFAIALAAAVILPFALFYARAFEDGGAPISTVLATPDLTEIMIATVGLALGSTVMAAILAVVLGLLVMRTPLRVRGLAAFLPQLPLVVPPVAMIIGFTFIFSPRVGYGNVLLRELPFFDHLQEGPIDIYSVSSIVVITGLDLTGIVFALVYARLNEISGSLTAAARLSGASAVKSFFTVTLPLLKPSLVAGVVVAFLLGLGQFTAPLLLGSSIGLEVLTTEIFRFREQYPIDYGATAALGLPLLIVGILAIVMQRKVVGDQRKYVSQGSAAGMATRPSWSAMWIIVAYTFATVALPLVAIALVAVSPHWTGDLSSLSFTSQHFEAAFANPAVLDSIINSMTTSLLAAAIVLPLGFIAALILSGVIKAPKAVHYILDVAFLAPLAVPRALLGVAVLYVFLRPPFSMYGTIALFVVGYAFVVLPFALRSQYSSLISVHSSLFEASRVCGAGQLATITNVAFPLARRGMTAALAIILILLSHDFGVSVMLRSPGNHVMGTVLYEFWETGVYPEVAVMALIMSLVTAALLAVTLWIGGKSALSKI